MTEEKQDTRSFIVVEFEGPGSVNVIKLNVQNVTPLQMIAFAGYLELAGKSQLAEAYSEAEKQQEATKLVVPGK